MCNHHPPPPPHHLCLHFPSLWSQVCWKVNSSRMCLSVQTKWISADWGWDAAEEVHHQNQRQCYLHRPSQVCGCRTKATTTRRNLLLRPFKGSTIEKDTTRISLEYIITRIRTMEKEQSTRLLTPKAENNRFRLHLPKLADSRKAHRIFLTLYIDNIKLYAWRSHSDW